MGIKVLYVVGGKDGIYRLGSNRGHVCHGSNQVRLNRLVDVKAKLSPR
jgi:hypothetical protein